MAADTEFDPDDLGPADDEDLNLDDACPNCGALYDEIDYEYQICHFCKYNNEKK